MNGPGSASVLVPRSLGTRDADQMTDFATIFAAANQIDQKSGVPVDAPPNQPASETTVTAVNGVPTNATVTNSKREENGLRKRQLSDFQLVFSGGGTGPNDRDAAIEGTAYLTYTVVPNSTYNIDACLQYCDSVQNCGLYHNFFTVAHPF